MLSNLLKKYNLQPRKGLGQHFLVDPFHLDKIVAAAELSASDTVLEIGPGPGTLTQRLIETAGRVIAIELDAGFVKLLREEYSQATNLTVMEGDILQMKLADLTPVAGSFKVVANLPYYITSAVLRQLLTHEPRPQRLVVTVQQEVAHRIVAQPGELSILGVSVQFYGQPHLVHRIPAGAFVPPPKVDSAVVQIDTFENLPVAATEVDYFFRVVKAGFSQKRKQLKNSLAGGLNQPTSEIVAVMNQVGLNPKRRAETLSLAEWGRLAVALRQNMSSTLTN